MKAQRARLDPGRWHFQHGPIDLVIGADGHAEALALSHEAAWRRFESLLGELACELVALRTPVVADCPLTGRVARRMWQACEPYREGFITPMAAVAGAVAQELIESYRRDGIERAWVNNGGDIALHLTPGTSVRIGLCSDPTPFAAGAAAPRCDTDFELQACQPVRGVATSGWRGRSFSLGIADSVTVLAATAAQADAAATVVANAVNVEDGHIVRRPASQLKDDSDLGNLEVTIEVPPLSAEQVARALRNGQRCARALHARGLLHAALLVCQGQRLQVPESPPDSDATDPALPLARGSVIANDAFRMPGRQAARGLRTGSLP